ncbi:prenyltransferase/squalene oxidase repeat-containing protein [Alicyclobacillus herbarius]|uniref:terpene cyclase/mutase family protein n=1 Tax=Alicyclobacillus herbarius TaxID=122960 RepID=UPI00235662AE|nr:prenyltransferase/squalene oxidase repeat-containing protein [Alicyclobacillus herbarius]
MRRLEKIQAGDGSWRYCFESGPMTDAYMILLLRALGLDEVDVIRQLSDRILSLQNDKGAWSLFHDEPSSGNISATVEAYSALLASGYVSPEEELMQQARQFIYQSGGLSRVGTATRAMLACNGQVPWKHYRIPLTWTLLPRWFPINFFDFVGYARAHVAPVLIAATCKASIRPPNTPNLNDLWVGIESRNSVTDTRPYPVKNRNDVRFINTWSLRRLERFLLNRVEPDGTLMSYASATFFMIYALIGMGYPKNHPVIVKAIEGLKSLMYPLSNGVHLQNSTSTVWDTASLSYAVQVNPKMDACKMLDKAQAYLLSRQQHITGDWQLRNPKAEAGGWGFSDINTLTPDVDDTTAALRAIAKSAKTNFRVHQAWHRGLNWLLSMQNSDGGWSAFERNTNKRILSTLKVDGVEAILTDPSTADLTGRTLEFLCNYAGYTLKDQAVQRAVNWLLRHQEANGSWYGRWGVCFIYGTWAALTGLLAAGLDAGHPSIRRAVAWLLDKQNEDGGWGESCLSDTNHSYMSLGRSTISQTAWATDALVAAFSETVPAIEQGVKFLVSEQHGCDWTNSYPTGGGLPGGFYIHYHSYNAIWTLLALGHYLKKYHPTDVEP